VPLVVVCAALRYTRCQWQDRLGAVERSAWADFLCLRQAVSSDRSVSLKVTGAAGRPLPMCASHRLANDTLDRRT
jgi:hypothetical protein